MLRRSWIAVLLVVGLLAGPALIGLWAGPARAADEKAPETNPAAQKAESLYKAGKIAEAREAFDALAKADPDNEEFQARAETLAQILDLQAFLATEEVSPAWERGVVILHAFFHKENLPEVALAHDKQQHAKADSAATASLVAETLLVLNRNEEAATFVGALREGQKDDQNRTYGGIALARLGKIEAVKKDLDLYGYPKTEDPGVLYDVARLQTLVGEHDVALKTLTKAFETCPARVLDGLKGLAKTNPDFQALRTGKAEAFATVMKTASKATGCGSGCGGGGCGGGGCDQQKSGDCGDCPKSGSCDKSGDCKGGDCKGKGEGCTGNCDDCPNKGKCEGAKCEGCDGDCDDCPKKGKCCGACKTGGECTEDCDCPNKRAKSEEPEKEGCCGGCK